MPPITLDQPLCTFDQETEPFVYEVAWPPSTLPSALAQGTLWNSVFTAATRISFDLIKDLLGRTRNTNNASVVLDVEGTNSQSFTDIEIYALMFNSIYGETTWATLLNAFGKIGERGGITDGGISILGGGQFADFQSSYNQGRSGRIFVIAVPMTSSDSTLTEAIYNRSHEVLATYALDEGLSRGSAWGNATQLTGGIPTHQQGGVQFPLPSGNNLYGAIRSRRVPANLTVQGGHSDASKYFYIWLPERLASISVASAVTGNPASQLWSMDSPTEGFFTETEVAVSAETGWGKRWVYRTRNPQSAIFEGTILHLQGAFNV